MVRRSVLSAFMLFALLVLPALAAFAADLPPAAPADPAGPDAVATQEDTPAPEPSAEDREPAKACSTPAETAVIEALQSDWMQEAAACNCKDQCRRDRDCKRVCGSLGGECVLVNSCCTECWCFG